MNELASADILGAELDLLATVEPIVLAAVSALVVTVMFGVWRLCAACPFSGRERPSAFLTRRPTAAVLGGSVRPSHSR